MLYPNADDLVLPFVVLATKDINCFTHQGFAWLCWT